MVHVYPWISSWKSRLAYSLGTRFLLFAYPDSENPKRTQREGKEKESGFFRVEIRFYHPFIRRPSQLRLYPITFLKKRAGPRYIFVLSVTDEEFSI
jgi:hypothetical protein